MVFSSPTLHPPVLVSDAHKAIALERLQAVSQKRREAAGAFAFAPSPPGQATIPLSTISSDGMFDAQIDVHLRGAPPNALIPLLLDSGNTCLILPDLDTIAALPSFAADYRILRDNVREPWGALAAIVRGPIELPTMGGGVYSLDDCVFYACKGPNGDGGRTNNFGLGCVTTWTSDHGIELRAPLTYGPALRYALVDYEASAVLTMGADPKVDGSSTLVLSAQPPPGFQMFDIVAGSPWMSLTPRRLTIEGKATAWPAVRAGSIAMVDTGGGPVYLSDPDRFVCGSAWPSPATLPDWATNGSVACEAVADRITVELGDANGSYAFAIDPARLPAPYRGRTLVMCQDCLYMRQQYGMNIGGISALFNEILIDFAGKRVGFKAR